MVAKSSWTEATPVRFGSKADMCPANGHVRFTSKADIAVPV
jgi:hypothetical protein